MNQNQLECVKGMSSYRSRKAFLDDYYGFDKKNATNIPEANVQESICALGDACDMVHNQPEGYGSFLSDMLKAINKTDYDIQYRAREYLSNLADRIDMKQRYRLSDNFGDIVVDSFSNDDIGFDKEAYLKVEEQMVGVLVQQRWKPSKKNSHNTKKPFGE
ncbi:MAG: hypothetical protein IJ837_02575 [Clostridia bacterium]|nr:hypothetical protein [Clostridia bacterium]